MSYSKSQDCGKWLSQSASCRKYMRQSVWVKTFAKAAAFVYKNYGYKIQLTVLSIPLAVGLNIGLLLQPVCVLSGLLLLLFYSSLYVQCIQNCPVFKEILRQRLSLTLGRTEILSRLQLFKYCTGGQDLSPLSAHTHTRTPVLVKWDHKKGAMHLRSASGQRTSGVLHVSK